MEKQHLLIIEDDVSVCELIHSCLNRAEYRISVAESGERALPLIEEDPPDIIILDLMLPGMNGLDICRIIRQDPWMSKIPVLMLTGRAEEDDIVAGLEGGADDYMTKPFSPKLLTARVKTLMRRSGHAVAEQNGKKNSSEQNIAPLLVKTLGKCELLIGGRRLSWLEEFSPSQRQLLAMLVASIEGKLSQEEIQTALWPDSPSKKARSSFDSLLSRVRKTLDEKLVPIDSKLYLVVKRGYLCLENVRIDAHEFRRLVRKGSQQIAAQEYWPAEISLSSAFSLWQGTFIPGNFGSESAITFQDELEQLYLDASQVFARLLARNKRFPQAVKLLKDAIRYEPTNDKLFKLIYQLCLAQGNPGQAKQILTSYTETLRRESFSSKDIDSVLSEFNNLQSSEDWLTSDVMGKF